MPAIKNTSEFNSQLWLIQVVKTIQHRQAGNLLKARYKLVQALKHFTSTIVDNLTQKERSTYQLKHSYVCSVYMTSTPISRKLGQ